MRPTRVAPTLFFGLLLIPLVARLVAGPTLAASPPALINYQGVLRDASDKPRNGTFDMVFSFFDAATAGNEILVDSHTAGGNNAVAVSNGLFTAQLGGGTVTDGSGAGTYTALDQVCRDYGAVWLEIKVGAETLTPRVRVQSSAYALNASNLGGQSAGTIVYAAPEGDEIAVYTGDRLFHRRNPTSGPSRDGREPPPRLNGP